MGITWRHKVAQANAGRGQKREVADMIESMKQALEALKDVGVLTDREWQAVHKNKANELRQAIAELESQEPVGWHLIEALYPQGERLDIRMGDGSILCNLLPQADGDLWWDGSGTGEKFIDPVYADVTHWRIHSNTAPPQRTWQGLTDEEKHKIWYEMQNIMGWYSFQEIAQAIEAKLKERNI